MPFTLDRYLNRIHTAKPETTAGGLAQLQQAQLCAIAFENIDPLRGILPDLEPRAICRKILDGGRGGYCLELNGLLGLALQALGFSFEPILAKVRMGLAEGGPRSHLAFLVEIEGDLWLADAGFGGPCPTRPLLLSDQVQMQDHDAFRIKIDSANGELVVEKSQNGDWFALYGFDRIKVHRCDLEAANVFCTHSNSSPFPQNLMLGRSTRQGRIGLFNKTFTETSASGRTERQITTVDELQAIVQNDFGIAVTDAELNHAACRIGFDDA